MGSHVCTIALLVLLVVAAADAHHKSSHATKHGGRVRAAHRTSKATPVTKGATGRSSSDELELETLKASKEIKFDFGDDGTLEKEMKATGRYDPKMVLVYDVTMDSYQRNRIFLTTPLMRRGIPVTLSTIPFDGEEDPKQKPYPNLDIHRTTEDTITDCDNQLVDIVTTVKTWADDDTLYAIDNGVLDLTTSPKNVCPPKIVAFDLRTDEVINSIVIQNAACNSMYSTLWVDASCDTGGLTAYISDTRGYVLTVTDLSTGASKHLQSQYFHPKPGFFFTKAGGPAYYIPHGLCGITAGESCDGKLYFQAFASNIQGVVDKHVLHDATDGEVLDIKTQLNLPGELPGTSGEMVVHPNGQLLFFPVLDDVAIYCWNTTKHHDPKNFRLIVQDSKRLEYVSSLNIETKTERLYVVSDRFTNYLSNTTDYSEENYRILYIDLKDIQC
ncbi:protein yellow-like [Schistocerca gregaria]|uniref:protein yellow-like n=1 Tax=Schistocerca gregaria TaxID=7010 RepID=UPI00211F2150|nr:protein yellow-like [Schistocerca gregaria]